MDHRHTSNWKYQQQLIPSRKKFPRCHWQANLCNGEISPTKLADMYNESFKYSSKTCFWGRQNVCTDHFSPQNHNQVTRLFPPDNYSWQVVQQDIILYVHRNQLGPIFFLNSCNKEEDQHCQHCIPVVTHDHDSPFHSFTGFSLAVAELYSDIPYLL